VICKRLVAKRAMFITSSIPITPPRLLNLPVDNFTLLGQSNPLPEMFKHRFYELCHEFKNYYRILLIALKKVTELQLLWSIETILSVFDYLIIIIIIIIKTLDYSRT